MRKTLWGSGSLPWVFFSGCSIDEFFFLQSKITTQLSVVGMLTRQSPTFQGKIQLRVRKRCLKVRHLKKCPCWWNKGWCLSIPILWSCPALLLLNLIQAPHPWGWPENSTAHWCFIPERHEGILEHWNSISKDVIKMASPSLGKVIKVIVVLSFHLCLVAVYKILPLVRTVHQSGWRCHLWY